MLPTSPATDLRWSAPSAGYVDFTEKVARPDAVADRCAVVLLSLLLLTAAFRSLAIGIKAAV